MNESVQQAAEALHPFFPFGVEIPTYVPNTLSALELVGTFAAGSVGIFLITYLVAKSCRANLSSSEMSTAMWFALCGCIHFFFEGYFAFNTMDMASRMDLFGQLWKEYALSDSRYMTQDAFVTCMEAITAIFWGPMSFFCVYCIITDHPMRHPVQLIVSLGQLYGDVLYYATCTFQDLVYSVAYCRPEQFYFWAYYFLCNAFWIVIPLALLFSSVRQISGAFAQIKAASLSKKGQ